MTTTRVAEKDLLVDFVTLMISAMPIKPWINIATTSVFWKPIGCRFVLLMVFVFDCFITSVRFVVIGCKVVPLDKWESHSPEKPLPGVEDQGEEKINGVLAKVVYILKPGCKQDHYSVKHRNSSKIKHETRFADFQEGVHQRMSGVLLATRAKVAFICIICFQLFCR